MIATRLAASGYVVKPHVANAPICDAPLVPKAVKKEPKSELQALFMRRLENEMSDRKISANQIAARAKARGFKIGQSTVSRVLRGDQDPTLQKLHAVSEGIGLPAWYLLSDPDQSEQRVIKPPPAPVPQAPSQNVVRLESHTDRLLKKQHQGKQKSRARTKRTG